MPTLSQNSKVELLEIRTEMMSHSTWRCQAPAIHSVARMKIQPYMLCFGISKWKVHNWCKVLTMQRPQNHFLINNLHPQKLQRIRLGLWNPGAGRSIYPVLNSYTEAEHFLKFLPMLLFCLIWKLFQRSFTIPLPKDPHLDIELMNTYFSFCIWYS